MRRTGQAVGGVLSLVAAGILTTAMSTATASAGQHSAIGPGDHPTVKLNLTRSGPPLKAAVPGPHSAHYAVGHSEAGRSPFVPEAGTTVPTTLYSLVAGQDGNTYDFSILGGNVTAGAGTTSVSTLVIPIVFTFTATGDVYDPTAQNSSCGETQTAISGMLNGPEFQKRLWYAGRTHVGDTQYTDAQMREELWSYTNPGGASPNFHVLLNGSWPGSFDVSVSSSVSAEINTGTCNALGEVDYGTWDSFVQGTLIPDAYADFGLTSTELPIFLTKNVVFTQNSGASCCILGYHNAFTYNGNTQTYSTSDYVTDGEFGGTTDLAASSHEIAEWANDPFVNNPTPSWGHTGQVSGCQGNLEVGDPLSGTVFTLHPTRPGGQTYHLQELAFLGWFYDANLGVNGWYSTRGTFTTGATLCS
jgi:hypothetical protein